MNLCLAVIASEQSERGNPKSKNNAKFMDCHAVFAKTARNDKRKKPKNKVFKKVNMPKSASNERERERERAGPRPNTAPFSLYLKALRYDGTKRL